MPLSPKRVIHRKVQRGREKGNATRDNTIGDLTNELQYSRVLKFRMRCITEEMLEVQRCCRLLDFM